MISGGTRGLGRALTLACGHAGWTPIALYAADSEAARDTEAAMRREEIRGRVLRVDVARDLDFDLNLDGEILLINNACPPVQLCPLHLVTWAEVLQQLEVNVAGSLNLARRFLRPMVRHGSGTIVSILSEVVGGAPGKGLTAYSIAKHGLHGLGRSLAAEYNSRGIRVFSISPGFMATQLTEGWPESVRSSLRTRSRTSIEEVAAFTVRLVADRATPGRGEDYAVGRAGM